MIDMRKNTINIMPKGKNIVASVKIDEKSIKLMLANLGVNPSEEIIKEAIGYLSSNSMEFTMNNLYHFLKSKKIVSCKDMRKKN